MFNSFDSGFDERDDDEFGGSCGSCPSENGDFMTARCSFHDFLSNTQPPPPPNEGVVSSSSGSIPLIIANVQKQVIPEIKDDWIDWNALLQFHTKSDNWTYSSQFETLYNDADKQDICTGDCGDTLKCVDHMLRPLSVLIERRGSQPVIWTEQMHKRLLHCDVLHAGTKSFRINTNIQNYVLRIDMYYIGWRFFLIIVCQDSSNISFHDSAQKFNLVVRGYHFIAIDVSKITTGKFDS